MKHIKRLFILLMSFTLFFVVGCDKPNVEDNPNNDSGVTQPENDTLKEFSNISFTDETFTYDGKSHSLEISGAIPEGTNVSYTNNDQTEVGIYEVSANLECSGYKPLTLKANMTINKANYDMAGISFLPVTAIYDGTVKKVEITGQLPEGVSVTYENNTLTDVGEVIATAHFSSTNPNYEQIEPMTAKLTVSKADFDINSVKFENKTVSYDGSAHEITIESALPTGVSVRYENNSLTEVGSVIAKAIFSVDLKNYNPLKEDTLTATLTVEYLKTLPGVTFNDKTIYYSNTIEEVLIEGTLPEGVSVIYENNKISRCDTYIARAIFVSDNPIYKCLEPLTATITVKIEGLEYRLSNDGNRYEIYSYDNKTKVLNLPFFIEGKRYYFVDGLLENADMLEEIYMIYEYNLTNALKSNTKPVIFTKDYYNSSNNYTVVSNYQGIKGVTGDFKWSLDKDGTYHLYAYTGSDKEIVMPKFGDNNSFVFAGDVFKGKDVHIFYNCPDKEENYKFNYILHNDYNGYKGVTKEGLKYYYSTINTAVIYDYVGNDKVLTIPETIDNNIVAGIDYHAFKNNSNLEEIYINHELGLHKGCVYNCDNVVVFYKGKFNTTVDFNLCTDYISNIKVSNDYKYVITKDNEVVLLKYLGTSKEVFLENTLDGMYINKVLPKAFDKDVTVIRNYMGVKGELENGLKWAYADYGVTIYGFNYKGVDEVIVPSTIDVNGVAKIVNAIHDIFPNNVNYIYNNHLYIYKEGYGVSNQIAIFDYSGTKGITDNGLKYAYVNNNTKCVLYDYIDHGEKEVVIPNTINGLPVESQIDFYSSIFKNKIILNCTNNVEHGYEVINGCTGKFATTTNGLKYAFLNTGEVIVYDYVGNEEAIEIPNIIDGHKVTVYYSISKTSNFKYIVFDEGVLSNYTGKVLYYNRRCIDNYTGEFGVYNDLLYLINANGEVIIREFLNNYNQHLNIPTYINGKKVTAVNNVRVQRQKYIFIPSTIDNVNINLQDCVLYTDSTTLNPNWVLTDSNVALNIVYNINPKGLMVMDDFVYYLDNNDKVYIIARLEVVWQIKSLDELVIPSTLGGNKVYGIGDYGFSICFYSVRKVTLEEGIESLGFKAFNDIVCYNNSILNGFIKCYLPKSIKYISTEVFASHYKVYAKCAKIDFNTVCKNIYWNNETEKTTVDGFKYYISNGYANVYEYVGDKHTVNVPLTIENMPTNINNLTTNRLAYFVVEKNNRINDYLNSSLVNNIIYCNDFTLDEININGIVHYNSKGEYGIINDVIYWYLNNDNTITVYDLDINKCDTYELNIPTHINKYPVTTIKGVNRVSSNAPEMLIKVPTTVTSITNVSLKSCNNSIQNIDGINRSFYNLNIFIPISVNTLNATFIQTIVFAEHKTKPLDWVYNGPHFTIANYDSRDGINGDESGLSWYLKNNGKATIVGSTFADTLVIPSSIGGYPVDVVHNLSKDVNTLVISEGIETITDRILVRAKVAYLPSTIINMPSIATSSGYTHAIYVNLPSMPNSWPIDWYDGNVIWNHKYEGNIK